MVDTGCLLVRQMVDSGMVVSGVDATVIMKRAIPKRMFCFSSHLAWSVSCVGSRCCWAPYFASNVGTRTCFTRSDDSLVQLATGVFQRVLISVGRDR